jgi:NAD(P)-dependent dehydrogenase (short-subunit alcohol dehydrogenase family)
MALLNGKAGLVTGASSGIGRATAVAFAREGAKIVIGDVEQARKGIEETIAIIKGSGGEAQFVPTDVSQANQVQRLVDATVAAFGRLDFAFNNAGVLATGFTADLDEKTFDHVMAVDVKGVWLCMQSQIRYMKEHGGGVIVNTASEAGLVGVPTAGAYSAAKHAVVGMTKTAAGEYANMGIRINAVAPGAIATPMVVTLPQAEQDMLMAPQPLHRFGTPEEVAEAVLWLVSDKSSFVLGSVLVIDGGATSNATSYDPATSPS